jgi:hypothetical protein
MLLEGLGIIRAIHRVISVRQCSDGAPRLQQAMEAAAAASPFVSLANELCQCGAVVVLGYVCYTMRIFSHSDVDGISRFVARVALPCLILLNMSSLDLSSLKESIFVVAAVMIAKALLFAIVVVVTAITSLPRTDERAADERSDDGGRSRRWLRRAGLYAVFTTQSNDFALGLPLLEAIWPGSHPCEPTAPTVPSQPS